MPLRNSKLQHSVASPKTRVSKDLSTHAREPISSLGSLQKASESAQSYVILSYGKCGSLDDIDVTVKHALRDYAVMLVYTSCVGF